MASRGLVIKLLLVMVWVIFCAAGQMRAGETPALRDADGGAVEWYVDDDGAGDPGPGDPTVSDPLEDGSIDHPFDRILEAINAAVTGEGDTITVALGIYTENIGFYGTNITLRSTDPEDAVVVEQTVIQGDGTNSVVTFSGSEGVNCEITGFTITGGNTSGSGGGIIGNGTTATISRCQVIGNTSAEAGGGIHGCDGLISRCIISGNVGKRGGGLAKCGGEIINCLISDNHATNYGGGLNNCDGEIINCTAANNSTDIEGVLSNCDGVFSNCIIWDNSPAGLYNCTAVFSYSCLEWVDLGTGNINKDPNFAFADYDHVDDYHIVSGSPCIDAGDNTSVPMGVVTDLDGEARFFDDPETIDTGSGTPPIVDMGSYEYNLTPRLSVTPLEFEISDLEGGANPEEQSLYIRNSGGGVLNWQVRESCSWLTADPCEGSSTGEINEVTLSIDTTGLVWGEYDCELTISALGAANSPQTVRVNLRVYEELLVPGKYATIQAAIDAAIDGDTVIVANGIYTGEGNRDIDFKGVAITVLSENGPEDCIIDCEGTIADRHRGFYFHTGEDSNSILDGFTITNGYGPEEKIGSYTRSVGGAIFCSNSNPRIINCIITDNSSEYGGGGIYSHESDLTILNCAFIENSSGDGGGMHNNRSNTKLLNCIFRSNTASGWGGGFYDTRSNSIIINCTFNGNTSSLPAGGIYCGLYNFLTIGNSVLWGNTPEEISSSPLAELKVIYSNVQGGWMGEGNINQDPVFFDADNGNYHLCPSSPCIEGGTNTPEGGLPLTDIEGINRLIDGNEDGQVVVDMGAYEYVPEPWISFLPEEIEFYTLEAGGDPEDQVLSIRNGGYGVLDWEISYDSSWLEIDPTDGISTGEPNEVVLMVDSIGMPWGTYHCEITISDPCAENSPQMINVTLQVIGPILELSESGFEFMAFEDGANPAEQYFTISNRGGGTLNWQVENDCYWLTVEPAEGSLTANDPCELITLRADITELEGGDYNYELTISDPCAENSPQMIDVTLQVIGPILELSESEFEFINFLDGADPQDQVFITRNAGGGTLNWQIDYDCDWLMVEPVNGSLPIDDPCEFVTLRVDITDLEQGDYNCELTISDPCALNSPQTVDVALHIIGPTIELSESKFKFIVFSEGVNPPDQYFSLRNAGGGVLNWKITYDSDWLSVEPLSGSLTKDCSSEPITLRVESFGLEKGAYNCELFVSDPCAMNSPQIVAVHFYIRRKIYVPQDFITIQEAIDDANDFDQVIVADGTYTGVGNRDIQFMGKAITMRSENGPENCIIDPNGTSEDQHRGFYFYGGEEPDSVLEGFTIINGYAREGGGIYCHSSSPTIRNCVIRSNQAEFYGGGIVCKYGSNPIIFNCTVHDNYSEGSGGGVSCNSYSNPAISFVTINNNRTDGGGGGVYSYDSSLSINHSNISGNNASYGGGIYIYFSGTQLLSNCTISNNTADSYGGGICIYVALNNTITNCLISGNGASAGGGIWNAQNDLALNNCTITINTADYGSGLACDAPGYPSQVDITNSILWDGGGEIWNNDGSTILVNYSDVEGGWAGTGNINADPLFADLSSSEPNDWDFHLRSQAGRWDPNMEEWVYDTVTSPSIDVGDPDMDWSGELWPHGGRVNMGAYGGRAEASMSLNEVGNRADLNHDGVVNLQDWDLFGDKWAWVEVLLAADMDRDGVVGVRDWYIFVTNWLWKEW